MMAPLQRSNQKGQSPSVGPMFSLIMPVYGVECYIADSIADVFTQTCGDFELIVVDDCSPDRSIAITEELAGNDVRLRIVRHDRNRGVSQARNSGIDVARGQWLLFLDPDDRYDSNLLETVRDAIDRHDSDIVVFGHVQEYFDAGGRHLFDNPLAPAGGTYERGPALGRAALSLEQQTHLGYVWNKAYRTQTVKEARLYFEDTALIEDILFNVAYMRHTQSAVTISSTPYRYAKRTSTNLTNKFVPDYFELHRRRIREVHDFIGESGALDEGALSTLGALYGRYVLSSLERNADPQANMNHARRLTWIEHLFADDLFNELLPFAHADGSVVLEACLRLLNTRNAAVLLALGRLMRFVRTHSAVIYSKAKLRR